MTAAAFIVLAIASIAIITALLRIGWRAASLHRGRRARPLFGVEHCLWRDPGDIERVNLADGPGGRDGAPSAPFSFIEEHASGSQPCVSVRDARGRRWRVKWGHEVQPETFAVRLVWACGYFAETTYYVGRGCIDGSRGLQRASRHVEENGTFCAARFELDDPGVLKLFDEHSWSWNDNPFVGTRELSGLKILLMLLSDWDNKDQRDNARGSNTAIYVHRLAHGRREARYLIADWGGAMGRWGSTVVTRGRWDPDGFAAQTPQFVTGTDGDCVTFGYNGQRTADASADIPVEHVRWLCGYLGRITDAQIASALDASGATADERDRFTAALRARIDQLLEVAGLTPQQTHG